MLWCAISVLSGIKALALTLSFPSLFSLSYPGRHFASYHVKIFLTTLLHTFRFEVDKAKSPGPSPVTISSENRGFGLRRPQGELFVKVTRI